MSSSSNGNSSTNDEDSGVGSLLKQTLMNVDECFLYKLPPLQSSGGHRAEHWDLAKPLQTCGFQVERRNNDLYLLFTTEDHTKLFALSKLHENACKSVESVMDSSRYFVTQVQSHGKSAYVGFGFRDRDVALDLLGNLQQFQKSIQREELAKTMKIAEIPKLAAGETMHISFGKDKGSSGSEKKRKSNKSSGGGVFLLKKPPKSGGETTNSTEEETPATAVAASTTTISPPDKDALHLSMGNINLQDDHKSVASSDSDVAHGGGEDIAGDGDDDDEDEWDDFQEAQ